MDTPLELIVGISDIVKRTVTIYPLKKGN